MCRHITISRSRYRPTPFQVLRGLRLRNTGHIANEIDLTGSECSEGVEVVSIKLSVFLVGHGVIVPASGSDIGHHSSLMLCSFTNQVLAQLDLVSFWNETTA